MFNRNITQGFKIAIDGTDSWEHSIDNWDCAITNTDYISEPEVNTSYIDVPFRDGLIDASDVISGRTTYKKRKIEIHLKGFKERMGWDSEISRLRNAYQGKKCRIIFDNDTGYFWRGRVSIEGFERERKLGRFNVVMDAEPFKWNLQASAEPWMWDTFNFITGVITKSGEVEIDGTATEVIPTGYMLVSPKFIVTEADNLSVTDGKYTLELKNGSNYDPRILVNGSKEVTLTFTGSGKVTINYRGGSL